MKLHFPKIDIETSRTFENESFGLGDVRVIMELLSSKIYARPKYIIVQEVASNARDANREAGRESTPIQIKLPSRLDDNLIIADSGPGISPKRMSEVFLKYGNSTKRADNVLTGGFGIGAKTPFTYTDTFNVVTITDDDDGKRRERTYIAHKASNGFAKMSLVDTKETTEETGTAISFAVKPNDFNDFISAAREVCRYWKVRPIVSGAPKWKWPEENILHSGQGWELSDGWRDAKLLIDGIPYSLRLETVFGDNRSSEAYQVLTHGSIRMYFNTGEIDVSATREDLDYNDRTIQAVKARADKCLVDLRSKVAKSVAGAKSLWEASIKWHNESSNYRQFLVEPEWNGKKLLQKRYSTTGHFAMKQLGNKYKNNTNSVYLRDAVKVTSFIKDNGAIVSKKSYGNRVNRDILVDNNIMLIEDDEGKDRPNRLRLQTIFDKNPQVSTVTVVLFKTKDGELWGEHILRWGEMPTTKLSSYPKAKKKRAANGKTYTINAIKHLAPSSNPNGWTKQWKADNTRSPEDTKGGMYVLLKNGHPIRPDGTPTSKETVESIFQFVDRKATVYAILYKYRNKVSDSWENIFDAAQKHLKTLEAKPNVKTYLKYGHCSRNANLGDEVVKVIKQSQAKIDDKSIEAFLKEADLASSAISDYNTYQRLATLLSEPSKTSKNEFSKLQAAMLERYPLLEKYNLILERWNLSSNDRAKFTNELIFYLNAKFAAEQAAKGVTNANP